MPDSVSPIEPEPTAEIRMGAIEVRRIYNAYRAAGFTEAQAMQIVCTHISASNQ